MNFSNVFCFVWYSEFFVWRDGERDFRDSRLSGMVGRCRSLIVKKKRGKEGESGGDRESLKKIKLQPNYQLEEAFIIILQHLQPFIQSVTVLEHMLDLLHCHLSYE